MPQATLDSAPVHTPDPHAARLLASVGLGALLLTLLQIPLVREIVSALAELFLPHAFNRTARQLWPLAWCGLGGLSLLAFISWQRWEASRIATARLAARAFWRGLQWLVTVVSFAVSSAIMFAIYQAQQAEGGEHSTVASPEEGFVTVVCSVSAVTLGFLIFRSWQERHPDPDSNLA